MKFKLQVDMDNAAFDDPSELPRILAGLAERIRRDPDLGAWNVMDVNGNTVGQGKFVGRRAS
jgi:hypothetical protein